MFEDVKGASILLNIKFLLKIQIVVAQQHKLQFPMIKGLSVPSVPLAQRVRKKTIHISHRATETTEG
jgi:hypothetical protein